MPNSDAPLSPRFDGFAQKVQASFERQNLMTTFCARLVSVLPGAVVIEAPISDGVQQQHGFAHAGLTFALGDSAAGYAALSLMEEPQEVLTVEMKINLLRPAAGERLRAEGRVVKAGRTLTVVEAEVFADETLCAKLQGTMIAS